MQKAFLVDSKELLSINLEYTMKYFIYTLFAVFLFSVGFSVIAQAAEGKPVQCGEPLSAEGIGGVKTDPGKDYCDIYARQMAYRLERLKYKAMLEERRENYHAPRKEAYDNYRANLESLNEERQDD